MLPMGDDFAGGEVAGELHDRSVLNATETGVARSCLRRQKTLAVALASALAACRPPADEMPQPELDPDASEGEREVQYEKNKVERSGNAVFGIHYATAANPVPFHIRVDYGDFFDRYTETQKLYDRAAAASYASLFFAVPTSIFLGVGLGDAIVDVNHPPGLLERNGEIAVWSLAGASLVGFVVSTVISVRALHQIPELYNRNLRRELRLSHAPQAAAGARRPIALAPGGILIRW